MGLTLLLCSEAATGGVLQEKVFLEIQQNSKENTCARVSFLIKLQASACNFVKEETLAQVFSCEFCKISENNFFKGHLRATASLCSITKSSTVYYWTRKIVICYEKWYGELKIKVKYTKIESQYSISILFAVFKVKFGLLSTKDVFYRFY